jgi:hypothetical protein
MNTEIETSIEINNQTEIESDFESDEHFDYIENELKSIYVEKHQTKEISEDESILNFVILGERVYNLNREQKNTLLKYLEQYYDSESNNELGDFINDLMFTYITISDINHLHIYIGELINNCELNLDVINTVYEFINKLLN